MDAGFPRGGLEKTFAVYDAIVSRHPPMHPSPLEPNPSPSNQGPKDEPPWWSPDEVDKAANGQNEQTQPPAENLPPPDPLTDGASGGFAKLVGGALAIRGAQSQAPGYSALRAAPEFESLAEPLLGEAAIPAAEGAAFGVTDLIPELAVGALGVSALDRLERNEYRNSPVQPGEVSFEVDGKTVPAKTFHETSSQQVASEPPTFKSDEMGLTNAYANPKGTYYDPATKTLSVKGSSTVTDWVQDAQLIPFGDTAQSERYGQAMDAYRDLTSSGKPVDRIVGHSLGGAVALEMQKNLAKQGRKVNTRTFGAPVLDPFGALSRGKSERFRHPLDPVSILDRGATWRPLKAYSHSYGGFEDFDKA